MARQNHNELAMERAIVLAREAEETEDPLVRYANSHLAAVYVSMARELRLGRIKSRTYMDGLIEPGPPPLPPPGPSALVESPGAAPPPLGAFEEASASTS